jgi:hypothetical protein
VGNADIGGIELDPRQRHQAAQCRCDDKHGRYVQMEPADPIVDAGRLMQQQIAVMNQIGGPARVVEGIPDIVEAVKDIDGVGEKRDDGYPDRGADPDDGRECPARQQAAEDRRTEGKASVHAGSRPMTRGGGRHSTENTLNGV